MEQRNQKLTTFPQFSNLQTCIKNYMNFHFHVRLSKEIGNWLMQATRSEPQFKKCYNAHKNLKSNNSVLFPQEDQKDYKEIHKLLKIKWFAFVQGLRKRKSEIESDRKKLFKNKVSKAGEMAQRLRALGTLTENPGSISSTHMAACTLSNFNSMTSNTLFCPLQAPDTNMVYIHACRQTCTYIK